MSVSHQLFEFLQGVPVDHIMKKEKPIHTVLSSDMVCQAIKVLATHQIISAPVLEPSTNTCSSMVDMLDIVCFIHHVAPDLTSLQENELRSLEVSGRALSYGKLSEVGDLSGKNPFIPMKYDVKISELAIHFSKGIRRVPIVDNHWKIVNIISQFDLIMFLKELSDKGLFPEFFQQEIGGICHGSPKIVSQQETVLGTIQTIVDSFPATAVALIDESGALKGNFSASDLRGLFREQLPSFLLPVKDFLRKHSPSSLLPVVARKETPLSEVLNLLVSNHVHHLWLIDQSAHPVGVVTLTCIISAISWNEHS